MSDRERPSFGTGGIRAVMGEGAENFNASLVREASLASARWALERYGENALSLGAIVCRDTRLRSDEFAAAAAEVFSSLGFRTLYFERPSPTPLLSYALRSRGACFGVSVTASHNPPQYNGYKIYGSDGVQLLPEDTGRIAALIGRLRSVGEAAFISERFPENRVRRAVTHLGDEVFKEYNELILSRFPRRGDAGALRAVYTPLFGAGLRPVCGLLARAGFESVSALETQSAEDGRFPGLATPNPESFSAFSAACARAYELGATLAFATDPDSDRLAACELYGGDFRPFSGNELGALLCDYVTRSFSFGGVPVVLKTVVTGELGASIARARGARVRETLTGFKYVGALMGALAPDERFAFAYEESCGYLASDLVRDKDAVSSALLLCLAAAERRSLGSTLTDRLGELEREFGFRADASASLPLKSDASRYMDALRADPPFDGAHTDDYTNCINGLPPADLLKYTLEDGSTVAARPSGTEPLLKLYYSASGADMPAAELRLAQLKKTMEAALR